MTVGGLSLCCLALSLLHIIGADLSEETIYNTFDGKICKTSCRIAATWCTTIDGSRDKCSNYEAKEIQTAHTSSNMYSPCQEPCNENTKTCKMLYSSGTCNPDDVIYFTKDYTEEGTTCAAPCLNYYDSGYKCFDSLGDWVRCAPFPNKQNKLIEIFRSINVYGAYTEQGYRLCGQCDCSPGVHVIPANRRNFSKDLTFNEINMTTIIKYYENEFPVHVVRQLNPAHIVSYTETNPVLSYSMMPIVGKWTNEGADQLFLPLMVTSLITNYTKPTRSVRSRLPTRVEKNYQKMNPANGDERTYIVDHRFNGPHELYNIFPGTRLLNRGQRSSWTYLKNAIAKFVHENAGAYVYQKTILGYDFEELYQGADFKGKSQVFNMRPNGIGVRVQFYNKENEMTDDQGVPLDDRPNPYENMFFSNNADYCCALDFTTLD